MKRKHELDINVVLEAIKISLNDVEDSLDNNKQHIKGIRSDIKYIEKILRKRNKNGT